MKIIAFEEHFTTEEQLDYLRLILEKEYPVPEVIKEEEALGLEVRWVPHSRFSSTLRGSNTILNRLLEVGEGRLREMDEDSKVSSCM